jgi:hypothetical protein
MVDWSTQMGSTSAEWVRRNEAERESTHGAGFGISGDAEVRAGGFKSVPVITSAPRETRAPEGFPYALCRIEAEAASSYQVVHRERDRSSRSPRGVAELGTDRS